MGNAILMASTLHIYSEESSDAGATVTITSTKTGSVMTKALGSNGHLWCKLVGGDVYTITKGDVSQKVVVGGNEMHDINVGYSTTTWKGIKQIVNAGRAAEFFTPGDRINVTLTTGEEVVFDVAGVNTYSGCLDFIAHDCLLQTKQHHTSNTNANGWSASDLKKWLNETFLTYLPDDLQSVITAKPVITSIGSQSTSLQTTECKIWIPTEYELFGKIAYAASTEAANHAQYPIFTDNNSRIKHLGANGDPTYWWEASPRVGDSTYFCYVDSSGSAYNAAASSSYGVAPGFRIQKES